MDTDFEFLYYRACLALAYRSGDGHHIRYYREQARAIVERQPDPKAFVSHHEKESDSMTAISGDQERSIDVQLEKIQLENIGLKESVGQLRQEVDSLRASQTKQQARLSRRPGPFAQWLAILVSISMVLLIAFLIAVYAKNWFGKPADVSITYDIAKLVEATLVGTAALIASLAYSLTRKE